MKNLLKAFVAFAFVFVMIPVWSQTQSFFDLVQKGTVEEIQAAIKNGADVNKPNEYGWPPIVLAAQSNSDPRVITELLKAGADAKVKSSEGKTAFDYAEGNEKLKGTKEYWALNKAQY